MSRTRRSPGATLPAPPLEEIVADLRVSEVVCGQCYGDRAERATDRPCANCEGTGRLWLTFDGAKISDRSLADRWRRWRLGAAHLVPKRRE